MDQLNDGKPHPPDVTAQWHKPAPVDANGQKIVDPATLGAGTTCYTDDPADGGEEISDCLCHKSCSTCRLSHGSKKDKPQGQDNCLTCRDGLYLNKLTMTGLARCDTQPCQMFCLQSAEVQMAWGFGGVVALLVSVALVFFTQRAKRRAERTSRLPMMTKASEVATYGSAEHGYEAPMVTQQ